MWRVPETLEPIMTTIEARISRQAKRSNPSTFAKAGKSKAKTKSSSPRPNSAQAENSEELLTTRVKKHDRILTLLSRREGATIPEMMEASGWQQHSVRGFLAGTVKKKLGFPLTSSKLAGEPRRCRIDSKRGR
jgi:hypothetical protein